MTPDLTWPREVPAPAEPGATTTRLRKLVPTCLHCLASLDGHAYRFFAMHPANAADDGRTAAFLQAIDSSDWAAVAASQLPAIGEEVFMLYALSCPHLSAGAGMIALVLIHHVPATPDRLMQQRRLGPAEMSALRAQCPSCPWISLVAK